MNIKYSIIIPHYNIPDLLQRCLDSVPKRNDIQIIVVDDNSDPDIVDFDKFPGKERANVEIYYTKEGKGAGYARNVGLKHAKGEWILFADADDMFSPSFNKLLTIEFEDSIDVIKYGFIRYLLDGSIDIEHSIIEGSLDKLEELKRREDLYMGFNCVAWNKMIRKRFIEFHKLVFEETMYCNDLNFAVDLSLANPLVKEINAPIYFQFERANSLVTKQDIYNYITRLNVTLRINKKLKTENLPFIRCDYFLYLIVQLSYFKFLQYSLKELYVLGWNEAYSDYRRVCDVRAFIDKNPIVHFVSMLRVKLSLRKYMKSFISCR